MLSINNGYLFEKIIKSNLNNIRKLINYLKWKKYKFRVNDVQLESAEEIRKFLNINRRKVGI
jgi:hypothetical protein